MHPFLRKIVLLALIFFAIFCILQPYNRFCINSGKCNEIYLSDLIPDREGKTQINIIAEVKNYRTDLDFALQNPQPISTVSGKKNIVNYRIQNLTDHNITFRPDFYVEPKEFEDYVIRRACLCAREYEIKKGETIFLRSVFKIDRRIDDDLILKENNNSVKIGYSLRSKS
ncbi:MAG: cytochrome c oxidase assembly protein [Rickettsiales bacterium]|nr:cytochrome c oxidase assembly protein [Rickettsiales bacterium]